MQAELNTFVEGLIRTLNYIIAEHRQARLEKIILCGSAAHTMNLDRYLVEQFELPVELISHYLLDDIVSYLPPTRANAGSWATAMGLALAKEKF